MSLEEYAKVPEGIWLVPLSYYPSATAESLYHCIISNHRCIIKREQNSNLSAREELELMLGFPDSLPTAAPVFP